MKTIAYQKPLLQRTGIVVVRKYITENVFRPYHSVDFAVPYKSVAERKKIVKKLLHKHRIVSVIPDI